ncbi:MAG: hypothetical protein NTZ93_00080 [Candidatus Beckwithbacteria bacterium]|nr:hypothetical protein [Candidatus Beckwithbacteria bacterium]
MKANIIFCEQQRGIGGEKMGQGGSETEKIVYNKTWDLPYNSAIEIPELAVWGIRALLLRPRSQAIGLIVAKPGIFSELMQGYKLLSQGIAKPGVKARNQLIPIKEPKKNWKLTKGNEMPHVFFDGNRSQGVIITGPNHKLTITFDEN